MNGSLVSSIAIAACALFPQPSSATDAHFQHVWSMQQGGSGNDYSYGIGLDADENVIVAGNFMGSAIIGGSTLVSAGGSDIFVAKYDRDGVPLWGVRFGGTHLDGASAVAVDMAGNIYVSGYFGGSVDFGGGVLTSDGVDDAFVASFTPAGAHRWSRRYGGPSSDRANELAITRSGHVAIVGTYYGNVDFGGGVISSMDFDAFILVLDSDGTYAWSAGYGTSVWELGNSVASDADGNVYMVVESAHVTVLYEDTQRTHVVKYDATGSLAWARVLPLNDNSPSDAAVDSQGNLIVAGLLLTCGDGTCYNSFVTKMSPEGDSIWTRRLPDVIPSYEWVGLADVVVDDADRIILTGLVHGAADIGGGPLGDTGDAFLARFDADGNHDVSAGFAATDAYPAEMRLTESGDLVLTGFFTGTLDFGGGVLSTLPFSPDGFVARFDVDVALSVAIRSFFAQANARGIELRGEFRSDLGVNAVNVYRAEGSGPFDRIESIFGATGNSFTYLDHSVQPGHSYRYMIGVVDEDGEFLSTVAQATAQLLYAELLQNVPNPFNPATTISFVLPERTRTSIVVYDANGRVVRTLVDEVRDVGRHHVTWDGRNDDGAVVASGVYFYRLSTGAFADTKKMLLVK